MFIRIAVASIMLWVTLSKPVFAIYQLSCACVCAVEHTNLWCQHHVLILSYLNMILQQPLILSECSSTFWPAIVILCNLVWLSLGLHFSQLFITMNTCTVLTNTISQCPAHNPWASTWCLQIKMQLLRIFTWCMSRPDMINESTGSDRSRNDWFREKRGVCVFFFCVFERGRNAGNVMAAINLCVCVFVCVCICERERREIGRATRLNSSHL